MNAIEKMKVWLNAHDEYGMYYVKGAIGYTDKLLLEEQKDKPPANADMVALRDWADSQPSAPWNEMYRELMFKIRELSKYTPIEAPADEGLVSREEVLKILRATMCEMACKDDMITKVYNLPRGHKASDKEVK